MEHDERGLEILDLGAVDYEKCLDAQRIMVKERIGGEVADRLLFVSHPPVITIGKSGGSEELLLSEAGLLDRGIRVCRTDRGGKSTFHGPGQLVAYPIVLLKRKDLSRYLRSLLEVVSSLIVDYGLVPELRPGTPGIWVNGKKIASVGISVKSWVAYHGIALNVNTDMSNFELITPCGVPGQPVTSMENELGAPQDLPEVKNVFARHFKKTFGFAEKPLKRPAWLRIPAPKGSDTGQTEDLLHELGLETVCQNAQCPNLGECFSGGTATFMILGANCTRNCRFCAVRHGDAERPDASEPGRVAQAVKKLALAYVVITSVTRDDLEDGGAAQFVETLRAIRALSPATLVEVLVPDFKGDRKAIETVCGEQPAMFNHNLETVLRLSPLVRPQADYRRSLDVLGQAAGRGLPVKSGLMLGLGESRAEVTESLQDLLGVGCTHLTIGQYLSPSGDHWPVARYVPPEEFEEWSSIAKGAGFHEVISGPLVRSSYKAHLFHGR